MDGQAWQVLRDLGAWQVTHIPRRPQVRHGSAPGADEQDTGTARRVQALVSAFHRGVPVTFGWIRERAEEPVRVLPAGPALAGGADAGQVVPGGARFPLQAHADLVRALFLAAFEADEPFPQVLAVALTRCYEDGSCDGQVQAVRRWHDAAQRDQQQVRSVTSGTGQPSAFPDSSWAAGQLRPAEGAET
jgi:hypothetical protein